MLDPRLVPFINESVESRLIDGQLSLVSSQREFVCDGDQALLWALCAESHSSIAELSYQFGTLEQASIKTDLAAFVESNIEAFVARGLLNLRADRVIEYPIDIHSYSHFASTRGGVYAANKDGYIKLAFGMFFGLCLDPDNNLLAFDFPHRHSTYWKQPFREAKKKCDVRDGVIRKFDMQGGFLQSVETQFSSLSNNVHELISVEQDYYAVDTESQAIQKIARDGVQQRIPVLSDSSYHHINSIRRLDDGWVVMKSISSPFDLSSGIALFGLDWRLAREIALPAYRAHDIALSADSTLDELDFWYCDSKRERIVHYPSEHAITVEPACEQDSTTRGLVDAGEHWLVGTGKHGRYVASSSDEKLAALRFINKQSQQVDYSFSFPEAPCCLITNPWFDAGD